MKKYIDEIIKLKIFKKLSGSIIDNRIKSLGEIKDFLLLWISQSLSSLGSSMSSYALLIWVYKQRGDTVSVALLALCTYLPSVIVSIFGGTFVDRHVKKRIIIICDTLAAMGTLFILGFMSYGKLEIYHIYIINIIVSIMNSFQTPANNVVISKIVPEKYYLKIAGLQSISSSIVGILTPALATTLISFFNIKYIFAFDIVTFLFACSVMIFYINIPENLDKNKRTNNKSYFEECREGLIYLKNHQPLFKLILFFTAINLAAYIGGGGITTTVTSMIFSRVDNGEIILGRFTLAVALGTLCGGLLVTCMKPPKSRVKAIFISCGISFFICDLSMGISQNPSVWIIANFIGNLPLSILNSNMTTIMRITIPIELQGRVFAARDALQYSTIPFGYLLGGVFADYLFEPFMKSSSPLQQMFSIVVGSGDGSGIALMFICTGITGSVISFWGLRCRSLKALD